MISFFIWFGPDHQLLTTNQLDLNPQQFWIIAHILYRLGGYEFVGRQYGNSPSMSVSVVIAEKWIVIWADFGIGYGAIQPSFSANSDISFGGV